jgi:hypothetical protein
MRCYVSDFKFSHSRFSKDEPRILRKDATCSFLYGIPVNSNVNMKLERRKEREKQEIVYFVRV